MIIFLGTHQVQKIWQLKSWQEFVEPAISPFLGVKRHSCAYFVTATWILSPNAPHCQLQPSVASENWEWTYCYRATNGSENVESDLLIRGRALARVSEKLSTLDVGDRLKNMKKKWTDPVDQKVGETRKRTCEKLEKTYAAVVAADKSTETGNTDASQKVNKAKMNHNIT